MRFALIVFDLISLNHVGFGRVGPELGHVIGKYGRVQFSSTLFGSLRFSSVRFASLQFGLVRFGLVQFGSVRFGLVQFSSVQVGLGKVQAARENKIRGPLRGFQRRNWFPAFITPPPPLAATA
jgi:hypothetical protein